MFIVKFLEKLLYNFRDALWDYPEAVFIDDKSAFGNFKRLYLKSRPISHFLLSALMIFLIVGTVSLDVRAVLPIDNSIYIEGVIVGVDKNGDLQNLARVNPLINTNIQLEKDISELVYESLIHVDQNGEVKPVLADFITIEEGKKYQFKLKEGIKWHDGEELTTEDVAATFNLISTLDDDPRTSTIYSRASRNIELTVIDDLSFEVELQSVIPAFFESMSFKILPAHQFADLNTNNITTSDPLLNRKPIGTGPFKLITTTDDTIEMLRNDDYREDISFERLKFKLFPDEESAVSAIKTGQIHAIAGISIDFLRQVKDLPQVDVVSSNVIYNQYWSLYFNLGDNGIAPFKDANVRRAISSAINKDKVIESFLGYGESATGPIPVSSFAYTDVKTYEYDVEKAKELLDKAGWVLPEGKTVREKDGVQLTFNMLVVDNEDRKKIAEVIRQDLEDIGIQVNIVAVNLESLINDYVIPRQFDTVLYGVESFIDPDRYELFHSSQIQHPGLNISSYKSEEEVLVVINNETTKIPEVDDILDDARKLIDKNKRKNEYEDFLTIIGNEVPAVFLFHPIETYVVNKRVKNVEISSINSIEERFANISSWKIELN